MAEYQGALPDKLSMTVSISPARFGYYNLLMTDNYNTSIPRDKSC